MSIYSEKVLLYRWMVFLLAAGYCLYRIITGDYSQPGGPFRFLTIWALFLSFYSASRMLARSQRRTSWSHDTTAMVAAVLNVMVVYLYWKLYFTDPALVRGNGPIIWHQEYYLHGLGPALQIFDALFIARAFGRPWYAIAPIILLIGAYVLWTETFVQMMNNVPKGSVTSGLPYPFLNSMEMMERTSFYITNIVAAMIVLVGLTVIGMIINLLWRHRRDGVTV